MIDVLTQSDTAANFLTEENLLRSINVIFDADHPERIRHFFPTTKSIALLQRLMLPVGTSGMFVVAPYGSGKSLLASFFQKVTENKREVIRELHPVLERISDLDEGLWNTLQERTEDSQMFRPTGIAVPIVGYVSNLPRTVCDGIVESLRRTGKDTHADSILDMPSSSMDDLISVLTYVREQLSAEIDRVEVLWDEFGRHLEEIVVRGEAHRLNELQLLSEFAARSRRIKLGLSLFLHQSLMRYATNVPQSIVGEWKKIEGRFETVQFIDDSKEIVSLAARVIDSRFHSTPDEQVLRELARNVSDTGLFHELKEEELHELISTSWPVLPTALYALPRISSRVAQNERTLFSFLFALNAETVIGVAEVFDYFSDLMRSDSTFGGTYHHWLETSNTLEHATTAVEDRVIKTLSVLGLGLSGDRNRVNLQLLISAASMPGQEAETRKAVHALIDRKVLLYRKNADTVLLWHATDIDLRGLLESEKTRLFVSFDLLTYLNEFLPAEDWRPVEYNSKYRMFRFFRGSYVSAREATNMERLAESWDSFGNTGDGAVLYVLPENTEDIDAVRHKLTKTIAVDDRLVWLLPKAVEGLFETALEAAAISRLLKDSSLAAEDPLVVPELQHMLDDSQAYLMRIMDRMFSPSPEGPNVIASGSIHQITSRRDFRSFLSSLIERIFPETPVFNNELINKSNPTQVLINARKKLTLGILDRYGTNDLGIEGNRPDRSMFATLLLRTGLYFADAHGRWRFAQPHEIEDARLRNVWQIVHDFFTSEPGRTRSFDELFTDLEQPPIGLRRGVIPILVAAGFRAFPSAISLADSRGDYISDIKPSVIEEITKDPDSYRIRIVPLDNGVEAYLHRIESIFAAELNDRGRVETDPLRRCYDALETWKANLPSASLQSRRFGEHALLFQRVINRATDPAKLLLEDLFQSFGVTIKEWEKLTNHVEKWKTELESVVDYYVAASSRSVTSALQVSDDTGVRASGESWVALLPEDIESRLEDGVSRAIIQRFRVPYDSDRALIDSLSSLLIGKRIERWDDSTISLFDREFRNAVRRIEDAALSVDRSNSSEVAKDLIVARMKNLYTQLVSTVGMDVAQDLIRKIERGEQ